MLLTIGLSTNGRYYSEPTPNPAIDVKYFKSINKADYSLLARIRHLRGEPRSRSPNTRQRCYAQPQLCLHKSQRMIRERNRRVNAVNSLSRSRLYPQMADRASSEYSCSLDLLAMT